MEKVHKSYRLQHAHFKERAEYNQGMLHLEVECPRPPNQNNMYKEIYEEEINCKITGVKQSDSHGLILIKEDGSRITFADHHEQDCCESVYADWKHVGDYTKDIIDKEFEEIVIKSVPEAGFLICLEERWGGSVKIFIPCYNYQNGYYSSKLTLIINDTIKIDVSDLVEDNIF